MMETFPGFLGKSVYKDQDMGAMRCPDEPSPEKIAGVNPGGAGVPVNASPPDSDLEYVGPGGHSRANECFCRLGDIRRYQPALGRPGLEPDQSTRSSGPSIGPIEAGVPDAIGR